MLLQVVLPMLSTEVVATGWVSESDFLTGLALIQALPGPLFNFAAYIGALSFLRCCCCLGLVPPIQLPGALFNLAAYIGVETSESSRCICHNEERLLRDDCIVNAKLS